MLTADFTTTISGLNVTLADTSRPPQNGRIEEVDIAWGDGATGSVDPGRTTVHTYAASGSYTITLSATDSALQTASKAQTITVTAPPPPPPPPPPGNGGGGGGGNGGGGGGGNGGGGGGGGGGGTPTASSGNYTVVSQRRTVQQLSSGQVVDVESVGFKTTPSNVYCEVLVPLLDWQNGNSAAYINPVATSIETIMSGQPVVSASFTQDVDVTTNLLADFEDFIVSYTPPGAHGAMTTTVRVSVSSLADGTASLPTQQIQAAYASLQSTASL